MNSIRVPLALGYWHLLAKAGCIMVGKCANSWCPTVRGHNPGKLFRLDINLGSKSGKNQRKVEYLWLCDRCAQVMHPKVEVIGNTVTLRLTKNDPMPMADTDGLIERVN
jgi:heterodisulfide reductase subunit C